MPCEHQDVNTPTVHIDGDTAGTLGSIEDEQLTISRFSMYDLIVMPLSPDIANLARNVAAMVQEQRIVVD